MNIHTIIKFVKKLRSYIIIILANIKNWQFFFPKKSVSNIDKGSVQNCLAEFNPNKSANNVTNRKEIVCK